MTRLRVRRCDGNRDCWAFIVLRHDGSEIEAYFSGSTNHSLDLLIKANAHMIIPGEAIELIVSDKERDVS